MNENPAPSSRRHDFGENYSGLAAGSILLLGLLLRLWNASGTFLNPDEAMHFLAANKSSLADAYRASLNLAHPPLLILLLHVWRQLGTSELFLRLPSVVAGTIFCWAFWRWSTRFWGPAAGWAGFLLVSFLPPFVELAGEVRQYSLLLCFVMAATYTLELALAKNSASMMAGFFLLLYLAMLTHFSAILFAGALGVYSLWRLVKVHPPHRIAAIWIAGQAGALGLFVFLYRSHISNLRDSASAQHVQELLANSYFHWGHDHLPGFVFARTFSVLQYTFGQRVAGDIAGLLFIAGVFRLLRSKSVPESPGPSSRQLAFLLALPFVVNCAAAIVGLYPYGGTRHSALLLPFAVAGVSVAIAHLARQRWGPALGAAILLAAVCQVFGAPRRPYMLREDQRRDHMTQATNAIRQKVTPDDVLFLDFQTSFLLRFYLCPEIGLGGTPGAAFQAYSCGGYQVISTNRETNVLTADTFLRRWNDIVRAYNLKPGQRVWIFQAGWDIGLARELPERFPEFRDLQSESFGRNISLFKLTV